MFLYITSVLSLNFRKIKADNTEKTGHPPTVRSPQKVADQWKKRIYDKDNLCE